MVYNTPYAEEVINIKESYPNGDIVSIRVFNVPKSMAKPEGVSYALAYIHDGERVLGYDNENHGTGISNHHKHLRGRVIPYSFIDIWTVIEIFVTETEHMRKNPCK